MIRIKRESILTIATRITFVLALTMSHTLSFAQEYRLQGKITDAENGDEIPGASILIKGTQKGTITDANGDYALTLNNDDEVIVISFIGYTTIEMNVQGRTTVNHALEPDMLELEEIVITGYGTQKKSIVTGAISQIDAATMKASRDLRIEQTLQGKAAGVVVMHDSGQPGSNMTIRIRGTGTNGDPDPLFIIDGLPMEKEGLDFLNPSDIQSVEILKDAAAAAVYGARGANGVVIITTKQGNYDQKTTVTYSGFYGVQNPWRKAELLNADQYIGIINEAAENDGRSTPVFPLSMTDSIDWSTNWQDEMYNYSAPKMSHSISFNGGSKNGTYSSSINYFAQEGIIAKGKSEFERITYRLNTARNMGKLKIGSNINLVNINTKGIDANTQYGAGINQALNMPPIVPVKYDNGDWGAPNQYGIGLQEITNPVALIDNINSETTTYKALGNGYAEYEILENLVFKTNFGGEVAFVNSSSYFPAFFVSATARRDFNGASKSINKYFRWNWDNTLTYKKSINQHNITLLGGFTRFREWSENLSGAKDSLIFDTFDKAYLNNSVMPEGRISNGFGEHTLQSFFGRVYYNYDEKYLLELVVRADGSSRFGENNRYGYFPAAALGWVFTKENFIPDAKWLDFGKLRLSWGQNGNENISDFQYTSTISNGHSYFFGANEDLYDGIQPSYYANPSLVWETSEQFDVGLDLTLFDGALTIVLDYYEKTTKDWLVSGNAAYSRVLGNNVSFINGGGVKNTGFEFQLGYKHAFTDKLNAGISFSGATNKNEVIYINNGEGELLGGGGVHGQGSIQRAVVGEPLGYFWGYKTDGIVQHPAELERLGHQPQAELGDLKFIDLNGDGELNEDDRTNIGNPFPKLNLGTTINIEYGQFDLSMFWYSAFGHQIWMANRRNDLFYSNYTVDVLDRWNGEDTSNEIPKVTLNDVNRSWRAPSEFFVHDADFLRLKNLTLGYTLSKNRLDKLKIHGLRFYVTAENLLTFTKYPGMEVEIGGGPLSMGIDYGVYPHSRTILGGVNITF